MQLTDLIANHIYTSSYENYPEHAIRKAKLCFLDWLGVTLAGSKEPCINILLDFVRQAGGHNQATVLGKKTRTSLQWAALVNGTAAHALDYDDIILSEPGHPSGPVIAAALAVAEANNSTGKELLTAIITGIHVEQAIGSPNINSFVEKGWHSTSIMGHFGAAAACCKLLGLNKEQIKNCLGIAATQAGGIRASFGTMSKPLHVGKAAMNGMFAALLAKKGYTAAEDVFEKKKTGFLEVFIKEYSQDKIVELLLDKEYSTLKGVGFKRYPCCFLNATAIECVFALQKKEGFPDIDPTMVKNIECKVYPDVTERVNNPNPKTGLEGQFSVQYCVATALLDKELNMRSFSNEKVRLPKIVSLMSKIKLRTIDSQQYKKDRCSEIMIEFKDGKKFSEAINLAELSRVTERVHKDVMEKFSQLTEYCGIKMHEKEIIDVVNNLDTIDSVQSVIKLCSS